MAVVLKMLPVDPDTNALSSSTWHHVEHAEIRTNTERLVAVTALYRNIFVWLFRLRFYQVPDRHSSLVPSNRRAIHTSNRSSIVKIANFRFDRFESNDNVYAVFDIRMVSVGVLNYIQEINGIR